LRSSVGMDFVQSPSNVETMIWAKTHHGNRGVEMAGFNTRLEHEE
jgi:hypothetical protein